MKRLPLSMVLAVLLALAGAAGLVRGAMGTSPVSAAPIAEPRQPIAVSGAYVREPANGVNAAAYFIISNLTDTTDELTAITSGAGAQTTLHTDSAGGMRQSSGLTIPAHGSVSLTPGKGHVMIDKLYGPLKPGQSVNLQLTFAKAGELLVTAPVIAIGAAPPNPKVPQ